MTNFFKIKGLAAIGTGDVIGTATSVIFWIYLAAVIEPSEYGEIHYFLGIVGIVSALALFVTQDSIIVLISKKLKIESTFYFISIIVGISFSIGLMIVFYRLDASLLLLGYIINTLAIGSLLGKKYYSSYGKYVILQKSLTLVLGLGFYFSFGYEGILYALALSYAGFLIIIFKNFKRTEINFSVLKPKMAFIFNNYLRQVTAGFGSGLDKIIIAPLLGFALLGNYSLALVIISVMMIPSMILYKYILPQDARGETNKKLRINLILISIGISGLGIIIAPTLIDIFFPKFVEVKDIIQIMSIAVVIRTVLVLYESKFLGLEKSKIVLVSAIIQVVSITVGMIVLGLTFGIVGLAYAYVIAVSLKLVFCVLTDKIFVKEGFA